MVDIIKLEDLTLDEIKARIVSLDSRFTQGTIGFTDRDGAYNSLSGRYVAKGIDVFTNLLTQITGKGVVFPYYCFVTHRDKQSSKPAREVLQTIENYCKELLRTHISNDLKSDLRRFREDVYDARVYSSLNSESDFDDRDCAKDNHLQQIEKHYLKALDIFEDVNNELVSYFKNFDIDTFLTKEFYICDVETPEPITSDIADEIDKVSALHREDIHVYEILDPVRSDMFLARPKTLVQELQKLCNMTIVKRYNKQNENLPNVISSADAKEQLLDDLSKHANSARNWVYKHLNERFEAAPNRSRERKILKHFKESTAPFNDKIISIYERDIKDYVETPFNQRLDYYLSKAFTTDLQNGNNNEKLRIINKVSSAIDEIEQIVKQLNSAYRDMLVHLYGDETES